MKYGPYLAAIALAVMSAACNDDIFVKPLEVSSTGNIIDWTGGECTLISNTPDFDATVAILRLSDGQYTTLSNIPATTDMHAGNSACSYSNGLFAIDMQLDQTEGRLTQQVAHNYYRDTIFIVSRILTSWENRKVTAAVLPAPEFKVGDISYDLYMWDTRDEDYIEHSFTYSYINGTDHVQHHKIFSKGQTLSYSSGYFRPWDAELNDAIFENRDILVPTVTYYPWMIQPEISPVKIKYSIEPQRIEGEVLIADDDCYVDVPPRGICHITLHVQAIINGFDFTLPAISPDGKIAVSVDGRYWQRTPKSYVVSTEFQEQ